MINRVVSKRVSRRNSNGLINNVEETPDVPEELLSPDSTKCLLQAEAIVEELLTCSRPASGESTDSGKGSLLESTSDFSPTSKRKSWSTPASPTFHGIVKERLKSFQVLNESSDSESVSSQPSLPSPIHRQKSFKNEEFVQEIQEINRSIKTFYCSVSQDESFNSAVMESGYVKALVAKINEHKPSDSDKNDSENGDTETEKLKLKACNKDDSGWQEWEQEMGEYGQNVEADGIGEYQRSSSRGVNYATAKSNNAVPAASAASLQSSSGSASPHEHSRANSVSDSDSHVSRALKRFNQERNKSIPQSRLSSVSTSTFCFHNTHIRSPPKLRNLNLNLKTNDSPLHIANNHRNTNGAVLSSCAKNRNCMSCDVESTVDQSAGQTGSAEKRGCVSQSFDFGLLPLNPAELFDENWSKCELSFDDFDCDLDALSDIKKKVRKNNSLDVVCMNHSLYIVGWVHLFILMLLKACLTLSTLKTTK